MIPILVAAAVLLYWILVCLDLRRWWPRSLDLRREATRRPPERNPGEFDPGEFDPDDVTVIIPARDEASVLRETLPRWFDQEASVRRIILVDDRSSDGTADLALELAAAHPSQSSDGEGSCVSRLELVRGSEAPCGWSGKMWALEQGIRRAREDGTPRWFLFTDADIAHPPDSVRLLRRIAEGQRRSLVSVMVRLRTRTAWERLLIPVFVYFFQFMYPFRRVRMEGSRVAAAAGGCVLIERALLERLGGIESIRDAIIDDVNLARRAKAVGGRLWLGLSREMVSVRGYETLGGIVRMVSRSAFDELRYSWVRLGVTLFGLALFYVSPPIICLHAALWHHPEAGLLAACAWTLQTLQLAPAVRHHRVPPRYALGLPFASLLYAWMTFFSAWRHLSGRGAAWKGRTLGRSQSSGSV